MKETLALKKILRTFKYSVVWKHKSKAIISSNKKKILELERYFQGKEAGFGWEKTNSIMNYDKDVAKKKKKKKDWLIMQNIKCDLPICLEGSQEWKLLMKKLAMSDCYQMVWRNHYEKCWLPRISSKTRNLKLEESLLPKDMPEKRPKLLRFQEIKKIKRSKLCSKSPSSTSEFQETNQDSDQEESEEIKMKPKIRTRRFDQVEEKKAGRI